MQVIDRLISMAGDAAAPDEAPGEENVGAEQKSAGAIR